MECCNMLIPNKKVLKKLAQRVESDFADLEGKTIVYVDYPLHSNVGDLLIYSGTLELLKRLGCKIETQYCLHNYGALLVRAIPDDWVILLHGGGNFGDIYPRHQKLRNDVIKTFTKNQIVMMPQSIHFSDPELFEKDVSIYLSHPRLKMHVRDHESYTFLKKYLDEDQVFLSPDMASVLLDHWAWNSLAVGTLYLRRRDCEKLATTKDVQPSFDWDDIFSPARKKICWNILKFVRFEGEYHRLLGGAWMWRKNVQWILSDAYHLFKPYQVVDADRLHGVIFALLLGKSVNMHDNSYGKLHRYSKAWFSELEAISK